MLRLLVVWGLFRLIRVAVAAGVVLALGGHGAQILIARSPRCTA
jgi:hypothetical protein